MTRYVTIEAGCSTERSEEHFENFELVGFECDRSLIRLSDSCMKIVTIRLLLLVRASKQIEPLGLFLSVH